MRKLNLSLLIGASLVITGCSTIWGGVGDFANFMEKETQFLSLRKSKTDREMVTNTAPTKDGLYHSSAGYYAPTGYEPAGSQMASTTSYVPQTSYAQDYVSFDYGSNTQENCPDGSYLTAENSCMLLASDDYELPPLPVHTQTNFVSNFPECPEGTYLTGDNSCMHLETETFPELAGATTSNTSGSYGGYSDYVNCPDGSYLTGDNQCEMFETDATDYLTSAPMITPYEVGGTYAEPFPGAATGTELNISCPDGTYKDPDNFCMRIDAYP